MLPRIKINFANGQLGTISPSVDGLVAIVCGATAVSTTFKLGKAYTLYNCADLTLLGVSQDNNPRLDKHVRDYYRQVGGGSRLIILGVDKSKTLTELCDEESGAVRQLIDEQAGDLRAVFVGLASPAAGDHAEGISADVITALPKAQAVAEYATHTLFAPLFVVVEGVGYSGDNLKDLSRLSYNRVAVLVGDTTPLSDGAAIGVLAGRMARVPVQRNIGRVLDGELRIDRAYLGRKPIEERSNQVTELNAKGYLTMRRYVGRSGYYFADDNLACSPKDDYSHIAARRVIDKAYRIAYQTLLDKQLDEIALNTDGTMQPAIIKSWQQSIEDAINGEMTAKGELSATEGDGCVCQINPQQNVVSTSTISVGLKVRPYGYARYIDVELGFEVSQEDNNQESS